MYSPFTAEETEAGNGCMAWGEELLSALCKICSQACCTPHPCHHSWRPHPSCLGCVLGSQLSWDSCGLSDRTGLGTGSRWLMYQARCSPRVERLGGGTCLVLPMSLLLLWPHVTIPFLTSELAAFPNRDRNRHRLPSCQSRKLRPRGEITGLTEPLANPNLWAARPRHLPRPLCWRVLVLVSNPKRHILCLILTEIFVLATCLWCTSSTCPGPLG